MSIELFSKSIEITQSIEDKVKYGLHKVNNIYEPVSQKVTLEKTRYGLFKVQIEHHGKDGRSAHAKADEDNFYTAVTSCIEKVRRQLDKKADK